MKKLVLSAFLASLIVLPACRAPHDKSQQAAPSSVGTSPPPAAAQPAASGGSISGQPLPDGQMMPISDVLTKYKGDLSGVAFYFGDQPHGG